jgi:hypothetical protein
MMTKRVKHDRATGSLCSLSHWERGGVRGYAVSIGSPPLTPTLSPSGRGNMSVMSMGLCIS